MPKRQVSKKQTRSEAENEIIHDSSDEEWLPYNSTDTSNSDNDDNIADSDTDKNISEPLSKKNKLTVGQKHYRDTLIKLEKQHCNNSDEHSKTIKTIKTINTINNNEIDGYITNKLIITEEMITTANLPLEDKAWCYERFKILQKMNNLHDCESMDDFYFNYDTEYLELRDEILKKLNNSKNSSLTELERELTLKDDIDEQETLRARILNSSLPNNVLKWVYRKYQKMIAMKSDDQEFIKLKQWINYALCVPTSLKQIKRDQESIARRMAAIKKKLDERLYGMNDIKERIIEVMASVFTNPTVKNRCIAIVGPPGTGKTSIGKALRDALDLPFTKFSLGGARDESIFKGSNYTYIGSEPGIFVRALMDFGCTNGIMLLDEFDKMDPKLADMFLHIIDYTQNDTFKDNYMPEIPIDMSNILFILCLNDESSLSEAMRNRMPLIRHNGYERVDKITITEKFIIPRHMDQVGIKRDQIIFTKDVVKEIVNSVEDEKGVRLLEYAVRTIINRLNVLIHSRDAKNRVIVKTSYHIDDFKLPFKLSKATVKKLLE